MPEPRKAQPFEYDLTAEDNEIARLRRQVENLEAALMHWRREADEDAGRLRRQHDALYRVAHGFDDLGKVREIAREALENRFHPFE